MMNHRLSTHASSACPVCSVDAALACKSAACHCTRRAPARRNGSASCILRWKRCKPDPSASLLVLCEQRPIALWHLCRRPVSISLTSEAWRQQKLSRV